MAQPAGRLALLIANQNYGGEIGRLKNPHNDVRVVGAALSRLGFDVGTPLQEATREQILTAVHEFAERLAAAGPAAIGMFYYSGHGVAVGADNVIVPVDAAGTNQRVLAISGVKLEEIATTLNERAPHALHFVLVDACRSNLGGARGSRGFVPVAERPGMFLSFSTAPGGTASDDGKEHGPYAAALASEMAVPGRHHGELFFAVRKRVAAATHNQQIPWAQDGLLRRVYFGGPSANRPTGPAQPSVPGEAAQVWALTKDTTDKAVLEAFIARYEGTFQANLARARLSSLNAKSEHASPAPAVPTQHLFDGGWEATFTGGNQCPPGVAGKYTFRVEKSAVRPWGGTVDASGAVAFETPASSRPNLRVRHTLNLSAHAGTGTFLTLGTTCSGTVSLRRANQP